MRTFTALCIVAITLAASSVQAGDRVVARVGSEAITFREISLVLVQSPDLSRTQAMDLLIERRLFLLWAQGRGISVSDEEIQEMVDSIRERNNMTPDRFEQVLLARGESKESFRAALAEQITINKALGMALSTQLNVSDEELQELYLETYPKEPLFEVSHILITAKGDDDEAREKAESILARIEGGTSFETMATEHSEDPSSSAKGGRLGSFKKGELFPELEEIIDTLSPGEVGGPVRTSAGYHILLLESVSQSEPPPLAEVQHILERTLLVEKEVSFRNTLLEELRETTYVEVFPDDG